MRKLLHFSKKINICGFVTRPIAMFYFVVSWKANTLNNYRHYENQQPGIWGWGKRGESWD
jgi:hypothetical protein